MHVRIQWFQDQDQDEDGSMAVDESMETKWPLYSLHWIL